jgi:hypothetical protein
MRDADAGLLANAGMRCCGHLCPRWGWGVVDAVGNWSQPGSCPILTQGPAGVKYTVLSIITTCHLEALQLPRNRITTGSIPYMPISPGGADEGWSMPAYASLMAV